LDSRSRYFQTLTRHFLGLRGAPLILSPREIQTLREWEKEGIPLYVLLDALDAFFGKVSLRKGGRKGVRLSHCSGEVRRHYLSFRERRVGGGIPAASADKKSLIREAAVGFLRDVPEGLDALKPLFHKAQSILRTGELDEEALEDLDAAVEDLLVRKAPAEEEAAIREEIAGLGLADRDEAERIFRLRLIKHLRSRHRIPYLSPFFY
jgi:hypothetical protein